jgi:hypothetical protein
VSSTPLSRVDFFENSFFDKLRAESEKHSLFYAS